MSEQGELGRSLGKALCRALGEALDLAALSEKVTERVLAEVERGREIRCTNCMDTVREDEVWCPSCAQSFECDRCGTTWRKDTVDLYCTDCGEERLDEAVVDEQTLRLEEIEEKLGVRQGEERATNCKRWKVVLETVGNLVGQKQYTGAEVMDLLHELAWEMGSRRELMKAYTELDRDCRELEVKVMGLEKLRGALKEVLG